MIADLKGIYETVEYDNPSFLKLYDNTDYEAYPLHWHTCMELILPVRGDYQVVFEGKSVTIHERELLLICPASIHSMEACRGMRYIFQADITQFCQQKNIESFFNLFYPGILITPEHAPEIYPRLLELTQDIISEYHDRSPSYDTMIYARLFEMIALLQRNYKNTAWQAMSKDSKQKEYMEKLMDVCSYIGEHCTESISLDQAADRVGFSKYHFSRLFKQFTGISFYRYVNKKRIEHAEQMLINPNISVTDVSLSSGFSTLSSFIRMFKQIKGCTPSEYRSIYFH